MMFMKPVVAMADESARLPEGRPLVRTYRPSN